MPKKDETFHICGDYKVTVNQNLNVDQYPLPKPEELSLPWPKLDLSQAYQQLLPDKDSKKYMTITPTKGSTSIPFVFWHSISTSIVPEDHRHHPARNTTCDLLLR